jgi:hypothetical protein
MGATTKETKKNGSEHSQKKVTDDSGSAVVISDHLPPLPLCLIVLFCSLGLLIFALRDFLTTGRNIGGSWDEAMLVSDSFAADAGLLLLQSLMCAQRCSQNQPTGTMIPEVGDQHKEDLVR